MQPRSALRVIPILSMNESCDSTAGDMEVDFPMVDKDTILLGINNRIYTLKRLTKIGFVGTI